MSNATKLIHSIPVDPLTGSISVPIYQTSTFVQDAPGEHKGYDYARTNNPTRETLEKITAQLEGGVAASAFASGLAAIDAVVKLLESGDEILAVDDIYGGAFRLFTHIYAKFGIKVNYVDTTEVVNVIDAITPQTKLVWLETPTNYSQAEQHTAVCGQYVCFTCIATTHITGCRYSDTQRHQIPGRPQRLDSRTGDKQKQRAGRQNKIHTERERGHIITTRQLAGDTWYRNTAPAREGTFKECTCCS